MMLTDAKNPTATRISITGEDSAESIVEVTKKLNKRMANQRITIYEDNDGNYEIAVRIKGKWFAAALVEV